MNNFNLTYWRTKFEQCYSSFHYLYEYAKNRNTILEHIKSLKITEIRSDGDHEKLLDSLEEGAKTFFNDDAIQNIEQALSIFSDQLIVLFVSIMDSMLIDFISCIFLNSTKSFFNVLNKEEYKDISRIHLIDIYNSTSKDELLAGHSEKISKRFLSGPMKEVFKRIEKLSDYRILDEKKNNIIELYDLRNRIVHELKQSNISVDRINFYYEVCNSFVDETGKILTKMKISFDDPEGIAFREFVEGAEAEFKKNG